MSAANSALHLFPLPACGRGVGGEEASSVFRACALGFGSIRALSGVAFRRSPFSLLVQRKGTKRKHTLFGGPAGSPAMLVLRGTRPNSAPYRRFGQSDASIPPEHCASRRLSRGPGKSKATASSAAPTSRQRSWRAFPSWLRSAQCIGLTRPRGSAEKRRRRGVWKSPTVRSAYRALSSATSPRLRASQGTRAAGANSGVCFFGYFLCTSKESNPRRRRPELTTRVQPANRSTKTKAPLSRVWLSRTDIESVRPLSQTLSHKGRGNHARSK